MSQKNLVWIVTEDANKFAEEILPLLVTEINSLKDDELALQLSKSLEAVVELKLVQSLPMLNLADTLIDHL